MRRQVVHAHRQYLVHRCRHLLPLLRLLRLLRRCRRRLAIIEAVLLRLRLRRRLLRRCRGWRIIEAMDHGLPFILLLGPQESGEHDDVERQVGALRHGVHEALELLHLLRLRLAVAVHPPAEQLGGLLRPQLPELPGAHDAAAAGHGLLRLLADLDLRRDEHAAAGEAAGERGEEEGPLLPAPDVVEHHEVPLPLERGGEARLDEPLRLHPTPAPHVVVGGLAAELVVAGGGVGLADDVVEEVGEAELAGDVDPRRAGEVLPDAVPPVEVARQRRLADAALAGEVDH
ncbi:hypothetical protein EE612_042550, partial [Oryza sativa]